MKKVIVLLSFWLITIPAFAWSNGELLIWMDGDRGPALEPILKKFEEKYSIKVRTEAPQNITDSFPTAAQSGKGPDRRGRRARGTGAYGEFRRLLRLEGRFGDSCEDGCVGSEGLRHHGQCCPAQRDRHSGESHGHGVGGCVQVGDG